VRRAPLALIALLLPLALAACVESRPAVHPAPPPESDAAANLRREHAYLLNPMEGYAQNVDPGRRERMERAYDALVTTGSVVPARQTAAELLSVAPSLAPAKVLAAQVDFAEGNYQAVVMRLLPVGDAQANYTASQLLLGRAAELAGDLPLAYSAYRAIATRNAKAFERTGDLHARALSALGDRLQKNLRAAVPGDDHLAEAQRQLALLEAWGPGELPTLEGARAVAVARHDAKAELEAVKGLSARQANDRELLDRRADLELEVGDPGAGLKIVQDLAEHHPEDAALKDKVRIAKFRWHVSLLPADVREVVKKPELNRADLAVLLYWLVPQVRYGKTNAGRIATDILDHPHREEIVHVVNLGLMDVDPTLHRFSPTAPLRRGAALRTLGRLLGGFGRRVACTSGAAGAGGVAGSNGVGGSGGGVGAGGVGAMSPCDLGVACGLTADEESCDAGDALSGADALEWIGRCLQLLGGT
jgi:hypothetical protein